MGGIKLPKKSQAHFLNFYNSQASGIEGSRLQDLQRPEEPGPTPFSGMAAEDNGQGCNSKKAKKSARVRSSH